MPASNPTVGSVHQNRALDNVAIGGYNQNFKLRNIFTPVPVDKETDVIHIWTAGDILRHEARKVRPGSKTPRGGFSTSTDTFSLDEWKFAWPIPKRVRMNADMAILREMNAARRVGEKIGLAAEKTIASVLTSTAWTGASTIDAAGGWNMNTATRDPIIDVTTQKLSIQNTIGKRVNKMAFSYNTYEHLRNNPYILERIGVTPGSGRPISGASPSSPAVINLGILQVLFDVEEIVVVEAIENTANAGATASYSPVLDDWVWLGYVSPTPAIDEPSCGYTFNHREYGSDIRIRTWREDDPEQDVTEASAFFQCKATLLTAGALIQDVLTT
ncbi:MAG: hypothetical protein KC729_00075 [Candidatus Eisenbacteria bacterium]|uniref:Major capsid protein n=1 Tax=Eiseniibacteriota bacterium TaxID=2212470 RepID=A0A956LVF9_UNCEI|nr:hypothetical protein [Candidatus Eisenbacteria bacterium]